MKGLLLCLTGLTGLVALQLGGLLYPFIAADKTFIVPGLLVLTLVITSLATPYRRVLSWTLEHQIAPSLGLLGTVLGFAVALGGISGDITADKLAGVNTALNTTITGLMCHLWLLVTREATR